MTIRQWLGVILSVTLFAVCGASFAQDKRYLNFHHATHVSGGWIAFNNGRLYACQFGEAGSAQAPDCAEAAGLPSDMQSVSVLWGEANTAWVAYTDGRVYGCRYSAGSRPAKPRCLPATGLP